MNLNIIGALFDYLKMSLESKFAYIWELYNSVQVYISYTYTYICIYILFYFRLSIISSGEVAAALENNYETLNGRWT